MGKTGDIQVGTLCRFAGGGINEYLNPMDLADNEFTSMTDVYLYEGWMYKRPGRLKTGPAFTGSFRGAFDYLLSDLTHKILVANDGHIYSVSGAVKTSIGTVTNEDLNFNQNQGIVYINGATTQKKFIATAIEDVGIAAPTSAPTVALGSATGVTGNYAFVYTAVYTDASGVEYESNPSPVSNSIVTTDDKISVTVPAAADTRTTSRRIYRSFDGGSQYYYDGELSNNTNNAVFTSSQNDVALGDQVEDNHGKPQAGHISCTSSIRQYWAVGNRVNVSETGGEEYFEYWNGQYVTAPNNGDITGLRVVYNYNTGREDLVIFQKNSVSILPNGDPGERLFNVSRKIGAVSQKATDIYRDMVFFYSNKQSVCMLYNYQIVDITTYNVPSSMRSSKDDNSVSLEVIFDRYISVAFRQSTSVLYNDVTFVCDINSIVQVGTQNAKAAWTRWNVCAEYFLSVDGVATYGFSNKDFSMSSYSTDNPQDYDGSTYTNIVWSVLTKDFYGGDLFSNKMPMTAGLKGEFSQTISIIPYYTELHKPADGGSFLGGELFVMGQSLMGSNTSKANSDIKARVSGATNGNTYSFKLTSDSKDVIFRLHSFQHTLKVTQVGI